MDTYAEMSRFVSCDLFSRLTCWLDYKARLLASTFLMTKLLMSNDLMEAWTRVIILLIFENTMFLTMSEWRLTKVCASPFAVSKRTLTYIPSRHSYREMVYSRSKTRCCFVKLYWRATSESRSCCSCLWYRNYQITTEIPRFGDRPDYDDFVYDWWPRILDHEPWDNLGGHQRLRIYAKAWICRSIYDFQRAGWKGCYRAVLRTH